MNLMDQFMYVMLAMAPFLHIIIMNRKPQPQLASNPGSFSWRKEPGNTGTTEPSTSATSSFM